MMTVFWDKARELGPEFVGGGIAYWTHHYLHRVWSGHAFKEVAKLMRKVRVHQ